MHRSIKTDVSFYKCIVSIIVEPLVEQSFARVLLSIFLIVYINKNRVRILIKKIKHNLHNRVYDLDVKRRNMIFGIKTKHKSMLSNGIVDWKITARI